MPGLNNFWYWWKNVNLQIKSAIKLMNRDRSIMDRDFTDGTCKEK